MLDRVILFLCRLINFPQTWGEQRIPGAWKGHPTHPVLFVFAQKTDKFQFVANSMWTGCRRRSAGSQSHPHIRAFGLWTIREQFANHLAHSCIRGFIYYLATTYVHWLFLLLIFGIFIKNADKLCCRNLSCCSFSLKIPSWKIFHLPVELRCFKDCHLLKYYKVQKWGSRFTFGMDAAKNTRYIQKCFK